MRNVFRLSLALAAVALLAGSALAQQRQQGSLLTNKSVQEELKLSEDQVKKVTDADKTIGDKRRAEMEKLTREERRGEKGRELGRKFTEELNAEAGKILKTEQQKRYKEIQFQQNFRRSLTGGRRGGGEQRAFYEAPAVADAMKFSDDQKEKLKTLNEETTKKVRAAREDAGQDFRKLREATTKIADETSESFQKILTADQKKKWEELSGKPFTIKIEPRTGTDL